MRLPAFAGCLAGVLSLLAPGSPAAADERDCSPHVSVRGYSDAFDKARYGGRPVGGLSALAVRADGSVDALSDRSALFRLDVPRGRVLGALPLADEAGRALDSEGLVADRDGTYLVTSETEPSVRRYAPDGRVLGRLPVPGPLRVAPDGRARVNRTFESLALLPGGRTLVAGMEGPLDGDGTDSAGRSLQRVQTWQRGRPGGEFRMGEQYGYGVEAGFALVELAAAGRGRVLVLERGFTPEFQIRVRLYVAGTRGATDVRDVEKLTEGGGVRLMRKRLLADLNACPSLGAPSRLPPGNNPLIDNIEGMAVTRGHPGGRLFDLLLVSDDNELDRQITRVYALRVALPR